MFHRHCKECTSQHLCHNELCSRLDMLLEDDLSSSIYKKELSDFLDRYIANRIIPCAPWYELTRSDRRHLMVEYLLTRCDKRRLGRVANTICVNIYSPGDVWRVLLVLVPVLVTLVATRRIMLKSASGLVSHKMLRGLGTSASSTLPGATKYINVESLYEEVIVCELLAASYLSNEKLDSVVDHITGRTAMLAFSVMQDHLISSAMEDSRRLKLETILVRKCVMEGTRLTYLIDCNDVKERYRELYASLTTDDV